MPPIGPAPPHTPLQSLIAARGVSRRWRHLVSEALLDPTRRKLLDFYLEVIERPIFLQTREHLIPHLQPFDRENFLDFLPEDSYAPDEFAMYVQEWPAKAVIGFLWPGFEDTVYPGDDTPFRDSGTRNTLGHSPPYIKNITYHTRSSTAAFPSTQCLHATTLLPGGIDIPPTVDGMGISWGDEYQEELEEEQMVSMDITAVCVTSLVSGGGHWMVVGGKRGGEKMHGIVYRGGLSGFGMHQDDIIANSWTEYLEWKLVRGERVAAGLASKHEHHSHSQVQTAQQKTSLGHNDFMLASWNF